MPSFLETGVTERKAQWQSYRDCVCHFAFLSFFRYVVRQKSCSKVLRWSIGIESWFLGIMIVLLPHRGSLVIMRKKNRDFDVRMLRMWNIQKSGLEKMFSVYVCGTRAKSRKNEWFVIRKRIELSGWHLMWWRSWYYFFIVMNLIGIVSVLNIFFITSLSKIRLSMPV